MTLPEMTHEQGAVFRRYFEAALQGAVIGAAVREQRMDEPDPTPSSIANEAFLVAAGAMDLDLRAITPKIIPDSPEGTLPHEVDSPA